MMKYFNNFEVAMALRYLSSTKSSKRFSLITIIAFIGIFLSVATLVIVMSVMQGFRQQLLSQLIGVNGHMTVIMPGGFHDDEQITLDNVNEKIEKIKEIDAVEWVIPTLQEPVYASGLSETAALIRGVRKSDLASFPFLANDKLFFGSNENFGVGHKGGKEILIGDGLARSLAVEVGDAVTLINARGEPTPFGVSFNRVSYIIAGIFSSGISEYNKSLIYMPLEQAMIFNRFSTVPTLEVRLKNGDLNNLREQKLKLDDLFMGKYPIIDWIEENESYFKALEIERKVMRIILSLIISLVALNIISGLVMQIKDKRKDIAILRTIGVTRGGIMRIFLISALLIGISGIIFGLIFAILFVENITSIEAFLSDLFQVKLFNSDIYQLYEIPAILDFGEVSFVIIWTLAMVFMASLYPSWKACQLDPVEALHNE